MAAYSKTIAIQAGTAATGLTWTAQFNDENGTSTGSPITTGFSELGGGNYSWTGDIPDSQFQGTIVFTSNTGRKYIQSINPVTLAETGSGPVLVDHNYGGTDELTYQTENGSGVSGATVMAYTFSDYNAGNTTHDFVVAQVVTTVGGRWAARMGLSPGDYVLVYTKPGQYGPDVKSITVA